MQPIAKMYEKNAITMILMSGSIQSNLTLVTFCKDAQANIVSSGVVVESCVSIWSILTAQ